MENSMQSISSSAREAVSLMKESISEMTAAAVPLENGGGQLHDLKQAAGLTVEKLSPSFGEPPDVNVSPLSVENAANTLVAEDAMEVAVDQVSSFLQFTGTDLELRVDADAGNRAVVSIYDGESGSLLRQYPTEEMLEIARRITEQMDEFKNSLINGGPPPSMKGLLTDTVV